MRRAHAIAVVLLLFAATAFQAAAIAQGGRGQETAQGSLNRAADAVLKLKSAQFTITREGTPAFLDEKSGITFTTAQCLYAAPDRVSCDVKITSKSGTVLQMTRIWVPEGTFQSNPLTRQYVKVPPDAVFNGALLFARTGIPEILQNGVASPQLAGNETVREKNTLHLKGAVKGDRLIAFMGPLFTADQLYPVDLWMEEQTANPVRMHVTEPAGNGWLIDLFAVNTPVDIPTPKVPVAAAPQR